MPYKNVTDRTAQSRRYRAAHPDREKRRHELYNTKHRHEKRDRDNERNFRFRFWEAARMKPEVKQFRENLFIGTVLQVDNPQFIFVHNGKRQYMDTLHEALPTW